MSKKRSVIKKTVICLLLFSLIFVVFIRRDSIISANGKNVEYSLGIDKEYEQIHRGYKRLKLKINNPKKEKIELKYQGIEVLDQEALENINEEYGYENATLENNTEKSATLTLKEDKTDLFEWGFNIVLINPSYKFEVWVNGEKVAAIGEDNQEIVESDTSTNTSNSVINYSGQFQTDESKGAIGYIGKNDTDNLSSLSKKMSSFDTVSTRNFVASNQKDVATAAEFVKAIQDSTVDQINLVASFTTNNATGVNKVNRDLIINGNKNQLTMGGTNANYLIQLDETDQTTPKELIMENIVITGSNSNSIASINGGKENWIMTLSNVSSTTSNQQRLYNGGATVRIENDWYARRATTSNAFVTTTGSVTIENVKMSSNTDVRGDLISAGGDIVINDSTFTNSTSTGAALAANFLTSSDGDIKITNTKFLSNTRITGTFATATNKTVTLENTTFDGATMNSPALKAKNDITIKESELNMTVNGSDFFATATTGNVNFVNIKFLPGMKLGGGIGSANETNGQVIFDSVSLEREDNDDAITIGGVLGKGKNVLVTNMSKIKNVTFSSYIYTSASSNTDSIFQIDKGSVIELKTSISTAPVSIYSSGGMINIFDERTLLKLTHDGNATGEFGGILNFYPGQTRPSYLNVKNSASLELYGINRNSTPAVMMESNGAEFNVDNHSKIHLENNGASNNMGSPIRYRYSGNSSFNISNYSSITIIKRSTGGGYNRAAGIRMNGGNNGITISDNSSFNVTNYGDGTPRNGTTGGGTSTNADNIGIQYINGLTNSSSNTKQKNYFKVNNESFVRIEAKSGPTIDAGYDVEVDITGSSYFQGLGTTATSSINSTNGAIFRSNSGSIYFNMEDVMYYNLRNNSGGSLITAGKSNGTGYFADSKPDTFLSIDSDASFWLKGKNLDGLPTYERSMITYKLTGVDYKLEDSPDIDFTNTFSNAGVNAYARISANNTTPIVSGILDVTNADKSFYVFINIHDGFDENNNKIIRSTYDNEAYARIKVTYPDGTKETKIGTTKAGPDSIYEKPNQSGYVKFDFDDFLPEGTKIEIEKVWRGDKDNEDAQRITPQEEIDALDKKSVIDVTPPVSPEVSTNLNNATKQLKGTASEDGLKVFIKVNGEWLKDENGNLVSTTVVNKEWTIDLPTYVDGGDKVAVYLKNNKTIDNVENINIELPTSYTTEPDNVYGNLSIDIDSYDQYVGYHDAIKTAEKDNRFDPGVEVIAKDVLPDNPQLVKSVVSSAGSTTSTGDTLTYTLVVTNDKAASDDWEDVKINDALPDGLLFDPKRHKVTVDGVVINENQGYTYDEAIRTLSVNIGNLAAKESKTITFETSVGSEAYGKEVKNIAHAIGYSPQVTENESGETTRIEISKDSNEVGAPGGTITGSLSLISAPTMIDFNVHKTKIYGEFLADNPNYDDSLVVNDTRAVQSGWNLQVVLEEVMTYTTDQTYKLPEALRYKKGSKETVLAENQPVEIISVPVNAQAGLYDISDSQWEQENDGFIMKLGANEYRKAGEYKAKLKFTLSDTP